MTQSIYCYNNRGCATPIRCSVKLSYMKEWITGEMPPKNHRIKMRVLLHHALVHKIILDQKTWGQPVIGALSLHPCPSRSYRRENMGPFGKSLIHFIIISSTSNSNCSLSNSGKHFINWKDRSKIFGHT